ncbi:hypothetical protein BGZ95_009296 [Linnemannia exigua]|uniref:Uncharacterized protein n=1 Tax=Linnemannia exigua TaxID=604196 RepID=A0AAD4DKQ5_9FUNG|nr:hypothetical protein BGZ95_009296 [Linnemannia exigua]
MAIKQQSTPFQIRNPYRLDRPNFDAVDVVKTALAEEEEFHRLHVLQQQYLSGVCAQRPLPPPPPTATTATTTTTTATVQKNSFEDDTNNNNSQNTWNGIHRVSNSIRRIKDFQRKNSIKGSERRQLKQQAKQQQQQQQQQHVNAALNLEESLPEDHHNYFSNSWLQSKGSTQSLTKQQRQQQQQQSHPQAPIPTITISHHIDTHAELTFERHVEWLTQTALWWDMPVVHLYPAPETPASLEYVETAASRFGSWVNFVKIPTGEDSRLGPATMAIKSANPSRVKGSRTKVITTATATTITITDDTASSVTVASIENEEDDTLIDGGMVMGHDLKSSAASSSTASSLYDPSKTIDPVVGYVFVGSADEQAQYSQVFDAMERLYPMIEIRYINSFEPQHLQSRQQQELREDSCLHSLSWVHYWSAAKESQVLQSRIVNEVVRVRPMWVNNDLLHRNYTPPQFPTSLTTANAAGASAVDDALVECLSPCPDSSAISPSPSVYISSNSSSSGDEYYYDDYNTNLEETLRGVPSSVSIETLVETNSAIDEPTRRLSTPRNRKSDNKDTTATVAAVADFDRFAQSESDLHGLSKRRPSLSRTRSSHDIRHDGYPKSSSSSSPSPSSHHRSKKSRSGSSSSSSSSCATAHKNDPSGCRRSVSTPLLLLTRGSSFSNKASSTTQHQQHQHQHYLDRMDSSSDSDTNMSPPLSLKSSPYSSSTSNLSSSSSTSSMAAAASMGFGHRLAGLAHRLGVYRVRGSAFMVVDL